MFLGRGQVARPRSLVSWDGRDTGSMTSHPAEIIAFGHGLHRPTTNSSVGKWSPSSTAAHETRSPDSPDQILITYTAEPGSPSHTALHLLASWNTKTDIRHSPSWRPRQLSAPSTTGPTSSASIDLENLGADHSLRADPTVSALRQAAQLLGDDVWIAVRPPGEHEGDGEADKGQVIKQRTTIVLGRDELTLLREAGLQLNAIDDLAEGEDNDLDPIE